ncbi:MAG: hypothetical protein HY286_02995 [Planctomycetes bacterium]|nr:hypothetical protein [Planctomycetota bacterium]
MRPTPFDEPSVRFLKWRLPIGDFKPWTRLLIMCGMLLAVGAAARSLSKRIQESKIRERVEEFLEADERVSTRFHPLIALEGFPADNCNINELPAAAARAYCGFVRDASGAPVEGATAAAGGRAAKSNRNGYFNVSGLSPRGPLAMVVSPPESRGDLGTVQIDDAGEGLPGFASAAGIIILPKRENENITKTDRAAAVSDATSTIAFSAGPDAASGENLDGWRRVDDPAASFAPSERRRDLFILQNGAVLGEIYTSPAGRGAAPKTANAHAVSGSVQFDADPPPSAFVAVNLYSSGVWFRTAQTGPDRSFTFRFDGIPEGDHQFVAIAPGYLPRRMELSCPLPVEGKTVELPLSQAAQTQVKVESKEPSPPRGLALRITGPNMRVAQIAFPDDGILKLNVLPAGPLRFELLIPSECAQTARFARPPLERCIDPVIRTLQPGDHNSNITFHLPPRLARLARVEGSTRPRAWAYRSGARFDEPATVARADENGKFTIWARPGDRVLAAMGNIPLLIPFASGTAGEFVQFDKPAAIEVTADPGAEIECILTGPDALGRAQIHGIADAAGIVKFTELPANVPALLQYERGGELLELPAATPGPGETAHASFHAREKS